MPLLTDKLVVQTDVKGMNLARQLADPPAKAEILGLVISYEDPVSPRALSALVRFENGLYGTMRGTTWRMIHPSRVPERIRTEREIDGTKPT